MKSRVVRICCSFILYGLFAFVACDKQPEPDTSAKTGAPKEEQTPEVADSVTIELAGVDSVSVLDLLARTYEVRMTATASGTFVKGINGVNNSDEYFWLYSVNDSLAQVAADRYIAADGDIIRWHFRKVRQ